MINPSPGLFHQIPHCSDIDERFHQYRFDNISNALFWNFIYDKLSDSNVVFDSIFEFGVGRCRSLISIASLMHFYRSIYSYPPHTCAVSIYGFDSFQGFPEPTHVDRSSVRDFPIKGEWSTSPSGKYEYSVEFASDILKNSLHPDSYELVTLVPGFFQSSLPSFFESLSNKSTVSPKVGILHLDGDLYSSVKFPLEFMSKYIVCGGLIVFDDFILDATPSSDAWPGARLAFDEFYQQNKSSFSLLANPRGCAVLQKI